MTGATGFIGRRLAARLVADHHELVVLTRDPARARGILPSPYEAYAWNPLLGPPPEKALEELDAVVHLAGESVGARRWTESQKREIRASRVLSTRHLMQGLLRSSEGRRLTLISASAVGFYGDRGDEILTEESPAGSGFLSSVCREWEGEAFSRSPKDARLVVPRFGMVLGPEGGALERLLPIFRKGLGGPVGSGQQWVSWIHLSDAVSLLHQALLDPGMNGVINAVAPVAARNRDFSHELAQTVGKSASLPAPAWAVRLALGEMASIALDSQRVSCEKALNSGFRFLYPEIGKALAFLR